MGRLQAWLFVKMEEAAIFGEEMVEPMHIEVYKRPGGPGAGEARTLNPTVLAADLRTWLDLYSGHTNTLRRTEMEPQPGGPLLVNGRRFEPGLQPPPPPQARLLFDQVWSPLCSSVLDVCQGDVEEYTWAEEHSLSTLVMYLEMYQIMDMYNILEM